MKWVKTFAAICAAAAVSGAGAQAPIKIGFMAELSGPQAPLGQDQYDAFMMVVEQNGGKLGGVPVQVIKEDSQLKPEVATQLVDKLIEKDKVPIITGITFSNVMMAVHKKITDQEVFLIGSNAGPAPIAGAQCSPYTFITSWQNDNQAEVVGEYANQKGYKRVIGMAPNYQAGKDFIAGFKRNYKGEVIDEIYTPLNQPDFSAELAQVAAKNPDAVYVFYPGGLGVNFVRQYKQAGLAGQGAAAVDVDHRRLDAAGAEGRRARRDLRHVLGTGLQQSGEPEVRRRLREEVQPHPVAVRRAVVRRRAAARLGDRQGQGQRRRQEGVPGGAQGGGLQERARQLQVQHQRLPDPGPVRVRGREGRQGPREPEDHRRRRSRTTRTRITRSASCRNGARVRRRDVTSKGRS